MIIRFLEEKDWEAYRSIRLEALSNVPEAFAADLKEQAGLSPEDWAARLRRPDAFVAGAFVDGRIVGMVGFARQQGPRVRHKGTVWGLYVTPAMRGKGIGRKLLEAVIERAGTLEGLEQLTLSVVTGNNAARQLYLRMGFDPYGLEPRALWVNGRYLDEEHMVYFLR